MSKIILTSEEKITLEQLHRVTKDRKKADKIKTILFLDRGFSYTETADLLMLDRDTIYKIKNKFMNDWINNFLDTNYVFYKWKLTNEQEKKIEDFVVWRYISDSKEIVNFIKSEFEIDYTISWVTKLLYRLDFTYKKTKQIPSKADQEKQEAHIEFYKRLKSNLTEEEMILFCDWVHPLHNSSNGYCWIKKWSEKDIKSNTWRNRLNINWAYSIEKQEVTIVTSEKINAQSTIELYKKIEAKYPDKTTIYIVRDNARYYNCNLVKEYLKNSRIKEIPLPPYSPNLNSIERLRLFFKKRITYNKYYEHFTDFKNAVEYFFGDWFSEYSYFLKTAVTDNFRAIQS